MEANGTTPDEIRWPSVDEYQPSGTIAAAGEDEVETASV
jgi:hypothetical protein